MCQPQVSQAESWRSSGLIFACPSIMKHGHRALHNLNCCLLKQNLSNLIDTQKEPAHFTGNVFPHLNPQKFLLKKRTLTNIISIKKKGLTFDLINNTFVGHTVNQESRVTTGSACMCNVSAWPVQLVTNCISSFKYSSCLTFIWSV